MKEKIRKYINDNKEELFKTIQEVVRIKSVVGNEQEMQAYMKKKYEELNLIVHEVEPNYEKVSSHEAFIDSGIPFENRRNIIGIYKGKKMGKSLTINGHVDVVSPEPLANWTRDPWGGDIIGNKLYGRGSADMKAGLISNWFALKALIDLGYPIAGDVQLHSVIEEEAGGGGGTLACLEEGFLTDGYISTEPHNLNMTISHAGIMYFRVHVIGRTAHAGLAHEGINAISKMMKIFNALDKLNDLRANNVKFELYEKGSGQSVHLNLGVLNAGDWVSTVPGKATLEGRIGFIPGETRHDIKQLVHNTIMKAVEGDEWMDKNPPMLEWFGWSTDPWYQNPEDPFVKLFQETAEDVMNRKVDIIGRASGNDARFTQYYGKQGLCFGPVGENMHGPDECVHLDSVVEVTNVLANYVINWSESATILNEKKCKTYMKNA
ncbi:ArgE/DapE family deacylase [Sporosarcina pasteurii]|uniref:N-formyl-4-amino-5-aminomethyl-2-methylpyrimidine deformylase n=1 Tax=Sporosarcina pasteurii TaxID=1474 RepID=A0A380CCE0_SPOPA|nr:ArgE/DapE family deacylase [Sporosarcina pasteurii]MDS9472656.1 ArgE/DapE family deacylase [Sporosarcina pasteurii]SUJ16019.1 N-formyl-4-amino-5-aminomethyl-2-methylpyrimidinedeformylase [Sporosarcina pasteurii]